MILYINAFNISFPAVEVTSKNKHLKREPWITLGLIKSSKTKAKLFAKKLSTPSDHNVKTYREFNIIHKRLQRRMKAMYYQNY